MNVYPFQKLIIYLAVISKFDSTKFAELLNTYLPSIKFDDDSPMFFVAEQLRKVPTPATILNGTYDKPTLKLFLKQQNLTALHVNFENPEFLDIVFDSDLRHKIDGMEISPVFRRLDILNEFQTLSPIILDVYLDCFAQFSKVNNLGIYIDTHIGDENEQNLFKRLLSNTSKQFAKVLLDLKLDSNNPKQNIERCCNISNLKLQQAFLSDDSVQIEKWIKLTTAISEKLHKLGAGNRSDLQDLLDLLQQKKDFEEPHIFTVEELNALPISDNDTIESA